MLKISSKYCVFWTFANHTVGTVLHSLFLNWVPLSRLLFYVVCSVCPLIFLLSQNFGNMPWLLLFLNAAIFLLQTTVVIPKIFEIIIFDPLESFLECEVLLSYRQYGFQPHRSTGDLLTLVFTGLPRRNIWSLWAFLRPSTEFDTKFFCRNCLRLNTLPAPIMDIKVRQWANHLRLNWCGLVRAISCRRFPRFSNYVQPLLFVFYLSTTPIQSILLPMTPLSIVPFLTTLLATQTPTSTAVVVYLSLNFALEHTSFCGSNNCYT